MLCVHEGWSWRRQAEARTAAEAAHPTPAPDRPLRSPQPWPGRDAPSSRTPYPALPTWLPPTAPRATSTHSISCQPGSLAASPPRVEASCSQFRANPVPAARSASASACRAPSPAEVNLPWILCPRPSVLQALLPHGLCLLMLSRTRLKRLSMRACMLSLPVSLPAGFPHAGCVQAHPVAAPALAWPLNPYNCSPPDGRCLAQEVSALPNLPSASGPGSVTHPQKPGPVTPDGTPLVTAEPSRAPRETQESHGVEAKPPQKRGPSCAFSPFSTLPFLLLAFSYRFSLMICPR